MRKPKYAQPPGLCSNQPFSPPSTIHQQQTRTFYEESAIAQSPPIHRSSTYPLLNINHQLQPAATQQSPVFLNPISTIPQLPLLDNSIGFYTPSDKTSMLSPVMASIPATDIPVLSNTPVAQSQYNTHSADGRNIIQSSTQEVSELCFTDCRATFFIVLEH